MMQRTVRPGTVVSSRQYGVCVTKQSTTGRCIVAPRCSVKPPNSTQDQKQKGQQQQRRHPRAWLAGCSAAVAGLLVPLLPSWALDLFDTDLSDFGAASDTSSIDAALADSPPLLDTLLVVVITYMTVMLLYLWLSSFMEDDGTTSPGGGSSSNKQSGSDQPEVPPGYGSFLNANVRSYVTPGSKQVTPLQDLGQVVEPLEGEDLAHLKNRLAAGAAEALELQLTNCERLVRSKLLARKLGYHPSRARQQAAADGSNGTTSSSSSSSSSSKVDHQIEEMMLAAVMTAPEGLGSWQHRAAVEALIDQQLDDLLPPGGGAFQEDLVVRQAMRRVVQHLVMEESLLLLEGTGKAAQMMEAARGGRKGGPGGGGGHNPWALW